MALRKAAVGAGILLLLSGCASIISDNETTTYISTDPEHAECRIEGEEFKRSVITPASMLLHAKHAPLTVQCSASGHHDETASLETKNDGWTLGNAVLGGIIGAAIDRATMAGQKYPESLHLDLQPTSFPTAQARDQWFLKQRQKAEAIWMARIDEAKAQCQEDDADDCLPEVTGLTRKRNVALSELELKGQAALVRSTEFATAQTLMAGTHGAPDAIPASDSVLNWTMPITLAEMVSPTPAAAPMASPAQTVDPSPETFRVPLGPTGITRGKLATVLRQHGYKDIDAAIGDALELRINSDAIDRFSKLPVQARDEILYIAGPLLRR